MGCNKDNLVVIPPVVETPKIYTITVVNKVMGVEQAKIVATGKSGESKTIDIEKIDNFTPISVKINNVNQGMISNSYNVVLADNVTVYCEYIENNVFFLKSTAWKLDSICHYQNGAYANCNILDDVATTDKYYYYSNMEYAIFHKNVTISYAGGVYSLNGTAIKIGGSTYTIKTLSESYFVYDGPTTVKNGISVFTRFVFVATK